MTAMTPAQREQQHNRRRGGQYQNKTHTDPGNSALTVVDRWTPPVPPPMFEDLADGNYCTGNDLVEHAQRAEPTLLLEQLRTTFPRLSSSDHTRYAAEMVRAALTAEWMSVEGAEAAWEAEAWDDTHPGEPPLLRVELDDYIDNDFDDPDGVTHEWGRIAEDNAEACQRRYSQLWREAETEDRLKADAA